MVNERGSFAILKVAHCWFYLFVSIKRKFLRREKTKDRSSLMRNIRSFFKDKYKILNFILFTLHWASRHIFLRRKRHDVFQELFSQTNVMTYHCQYFLPVLLRPCLNNDLREHFYILHFSNSLQCSMAFIYLNCIEESSDYLNLQEKIMQHLLYHTFFLFNQYIWLLFLSYFILAPNKK